MKATHIDIMHMKAAEGWLELGNYLEADRELDEITPELRAHPDVLLKRCERYSRAKKWDSLLTIADAVVNMAPKREQAWIHRSFALHAMKRTQEAFNRLLPAVKMFPKSWLVRYNLACYCAQLGKIKDAEDWFKRAMALDEKAVMRIALDDPDLEPLWKGEDTSWKRA